MQQVKIQRVLDVGISVVMERVHSREPFGDQMIALSVEEACYPSVAHELCDYHRCKILYHLSCRRQPSLCKVFNIAHEL
jgi:hypothetical protein